jgi:hypothetical protein
MPLLRRSYGHHRDLPACSSGARAASIVSLLWDLCVVTPRDEPQPAVEAMRLRPVGRHAPASIATSTIALMTATSACPPPSHRANAIRVNRPFRQAPTASRRAQSPRHPYGPPKSSNPHNVAPVPRGRFPYAGPCLTLDLRAPASENLHHTGHPVITPTIPRAVICSSDMRGFGALASSPPGRALVRAARTSGSCRWQSSAIPRTLPASAP